MNDLEAIILAIIGVACLVGLYVQLKNKTYKYNTMNWFPIIAYAIGAAVCFYGTIKHFIS